MALRKQLVVVGHGMVGHRFVESAISRGLTETYDITVLGDEPRPAYDRVALTSYFEVGAEALSYLPSGQVRRPAGHPAHQHRGRGDLAAAADRHPRLRCGPALRRAGAGHRRRAVRAARPGHDLTTASSTGPSRISRTSAMRARKGKVGAVIGGGLLGLEAANALHQLGLRPMSSSWRPG